MGLTFKNLSFDTMGGKKISVGEIDFDSSYDAGGEVVDHRSVGLPKVSHMIVGATGGYQFHFDKSNGKLIAYFGGGGASGTPTGTVSQPTFTPNNLSALSYNVIHSATAANGAPLYVNLPVEEYGLPFFSQGSGQQIVFTTVGGAEVFSLVDARTEDTTVTMTHDAAAATNGTQVHARLGAIPLLASLVSNNAGSAPSTFTDTSSNTSFTVVYDATPTTVSFPLYFDESAASGSRVLAVTPTGEDLMVMSNDGVSFGITHDLNAATSGVPIYFDDNGTPSSSRLLFVSPTSSNSSISVMATAVNDFILGQKFRFPVYFNENGASGDKLIADLTNIGGSDLKVPSNQGRVLHVKHDASASSNGVRVYVNSSSPGDSVLEFVSPSSSNQTDTLDDAMSLLTPLTTGVVSQPTFTGDPLSGGSSLETEVSNTFDLSALVDVPFIAIA